MLAVFPLFSDALVTPSARHRPISMAADGSRGGLRLLEWIPSQKLLVKTGRFTWNTLWKTMLSELAPQSADGAYVRPAPQLGTDAAWPADLPLEPGRYHAYLGNACPWCHRVSIALALRGLLGTTITTTRLDDNPEKASRGGWCFSESDPDPLLGAADLREVYNALTPGDEDYKGRVTAPLLVDLKDGGRIISNESGDIVRMLGGAAFPAAADAAPLCPPELRSQIDEVNAWTYELVNNGVYRAGFCTKQAAYEEAERDVHDGLARAEALLASQPYLLGDTVTEADVRLLPTAVRFDGVYASFFRCGRRQIRSDYPAVGRWMRDMLERTGPGLFDLAEARRSYYSNLFPLNPGGIVPAGPSAADEGARTALREQRPHLSRGQAPVSGRQDRKGEGRAHPQLLCTLHG